MHSTIKIFKNYLLAKQKVKNKENTIDKAFVKNQRYSCEKKDIKNRWDTLGLKGNLNLNQISSL